VPPSVVLQLSDTHLRATAGDLVFGRDPDERLTAVLRAWTATGQTADLVLLSGDLADDGSSAGCARLAEAVARVGAPVLAIPGNHDLPEVVAATWGGADVAEVGRWLVVGVDTTVPGEVHGAVDVPAVTARLDALEARPTLLALHHPPISRSTGDQFRLDGADDLLEALARRPAVRAVVAGHLHDAVDLAAPDGLPVLGCPATVVAITHDGDEMEIAPEATTGARVIELHDDGSLTSHILDA
jgi:Icc protein